MFRRTLTRAIEFGEQAKKPHFEPTYGHQHLPKRRWGKGPGHRTVESNRLVSMPLFQPIVKEIDLEHMVENGMTMDDIRWLDERVLKWNCTRCGHSWLMRVSNRTKNGAGCPECATDIPSVTNSESKSTTVASLYSSKPNPFAQCQNFVSSIDAASRRVLSNIQCTLCKRSFRRSVRCTTGVVCEGQNPVTKQDVCDACLWTTRVMKKVEEFE
ncbi:IgM heavy chain variable region [Perkinsela sp. CCAP 1560/4]|nr:IgM heavy chain variable region [Perkinsela sp. CCAP 1560/4]|eukprot:KNH09739.1 IgM heavy chain variable region [Perkinsela sp. CCAP 1560/4]